MRIWEKVEPRSPAARGEFQKRGVAIATSRRLHQRRMHHRGRWSLVTQITCLTLAASGLFSAGVTGTVVSSTEQDVHYENVEYAVTDDTTAYNRHRQGGASITTHAMTSLVASWFRPRANSKDAPDGSERGNRKYSEAPTSDHRQGGGSLATHAMASPAAPLLRPLVRNESDGALPCARWICLRHISKKFVAVRSLHVQASALGRAVLGTVFLATSLLVMASLFALVWCFCRSCRGAKKEDNPLATRTPPPAYTAPKGGSFGGMHSVLIDPPPPYGSVIDSTAASVHCIGTRQPNGSVPSQGADQPPAYDASMSSSAPPQTASEIPRL
ncbi:uncharacterized protein LOC142560402 [Dermacentor variabilis]|uniref:uncharacterized protein LOC142560402 n=1 Tax=Dermacentor variabilis TaxID=34621 RepID=UPI003F5C0CA2